MFKNGKNNRGTLSIDRIFRSGPLWEEKSEIVILLFKSVLNLDQSVYLSYIE